MSLDQLEFDDIYKLELGKLMYKVGNNEFSLHSIKNCINTVIQDVHSRNTKQTEKSIFFRPFVSKSSVKLKLHYVPENFSLTLMKI